ncbi:MAG: cation transporter [Crocinitomicaceae bacterium]|mgnify:FL=1|nr:MULTISPECIES: cation diffusion facilitator family transporter [Cytophagales]MAX79792.1 cation transporter [Crocinitomicaceae bacterium]MBE63271.1 cation transporter [Flammeovirgaceae bacterium]QNR26105.1 cation transporter [Croceimicrobium hydrocarbonivorans]HCX21930.1 cation transporter [Cytophagales bacterium]MBE63577.1 cation transporter [Flammeovirgaceae bacterium]|tara:strand:- start:3108 stop:3995 length:888 start_codon:yes stop_codon:yes gene_type:complete
MGHNHNHSHNHSEGNVKVAFFLNLAFTIIEIIGGLYTNSLAILSDALHDLGDSLSLGLSWYFQKLSKKGRTKTFSYGYKRFSLLGAIINSIVLVAGSIFILTKAIPELFNPGETNVEGMLYLSILGIVVNGAAVFKLRKGESLNEKVVSLHLLEDVLGWVAVLIGSVIMMYTDAPFIDPLLSVLISLFVLYNVYKNLKKSLLVILQGIPEEISIDDIRQKLKNISKVTDIHDCHAWSMDGQYNILTLHLRLDKDYKLSEQAKLKEQVRTQLKDESINHITIEFEAQGENCELEDC